MTRHSQIAAAWLAAAALMVVQAGCQNIDPSKGYTTASQYRKDVRTIAVPIFHRGAGEFRRDIEIRLTEAIIKYIESETPYKVVDKSRADSILIGTLNSAKIQPLSIDTRTGRPREVQVRLNVDFTWKDLRGAGRIYVQRKNFRVAAEYLPAEPLSEDFFLGSEDALNKLAQRIVEQLAEPW